jgi:hypothetical protein
MIVEDYLRQSVGHLMTDLMFRLAIAQAEIDTLKAEVARLSLPEAPTLTSVAEPIS